MRLRLAFGVRRSREGSKSEEDGSDERETHGGGYNGWGWMLEDKSQVVVLSGECDGLDLTALQETDGPATARGRAAITPSKFLS